MSPSHLPIGTYAKVHRQPAGPNDSRPTTTQIIRDENLDHPPNRLSDKTVLVTGGTSGLGLEVAKALHLTGAKVFVTGRCDPAKGREIAASISQKGEDIGSVRPVQFISMDLSDLSSVRSGATDFLKKSDDKLNLLICNAGVMAPQTRTTTAQDHEMQFGVNHLAHFLLFKLLCPALLECSTKELASRVISVSSCAHRGSGVLDNGDYDFEKTKYEPHVAYGQSKTANIYMANSIERHFGTQGLHGLSVHPGIIMETSLVRHMTDDSEKFTAQLSEAMPKFAGQVKSAPQGAASIVWAGVAEKLEGMGGVFLEDCDVSQPVEEGAEWFEPGREKWGYDEVAEEKLWVDSEGMVKAWL